MDGRYEVALPWKQPRLPLSDNFAIAKKRLFKATEKLKSVDQYSMYDQIFKDWESLGIIERVAEENPKTEGVHYLPHRGVFKADSATTKLRPVFDASCVDRNKRSLNSCLESGPNLIELIPALLLRFRKGEVGVIADITKAFLQIGVYPEDRDSLRFLWWEDESQERIKIYRHRRVVFGVTSSPFLLGATIDYHLDKEKDTFPDTISQLKDSFYVDNVVYSLEDSECERFATETTAVMAKGGFELRGWIKTLTTETEQNVLDEAGTSHTTPVLGLMWDFKQDLLYGKLGPVVYEDSGVLTKRRVLSITQSIFDPLGFYAPVTLIPKLLLQEIVRMGLTWDEELPAAVASKFRRWQERLPRLLDYGIPRHLGKIDRENSSYHVFCDASKDAFAACVYLRHDNGLSATVRFVAAKAFVAPMKRVKPKDETLPVQFIKPSIPRLELLAAAVGARLFSRVQTSLKVELPVTFWSDSKVALYWILRDNNWSVFVRNRVAEIRRLTNRDSWRHVPGSINPADLPSRGCDAQVFMQAKWWEGPTWLELDPDTFPSKNLDFKDYEPEIKEELMKTATVNVNVTISLDEDPFSVLDRRIGSYQKLIRVQAWIRRFAFNSLRPEKKCRDQFLSATEIMAAEVDVLRWVQGTYLKEKDFERLKTFRDENGLIRVKVRARTIEELQDPILLPKCELVQKLIRDEHLRNSHAGTNTMLNLLRENFWILKGRQLTQKVFNGCLPCKRYTARKAVVPEAPLPVERTSLGPVFGVTGVDLAGHLWLRSGDKAWVVIFTCAVYRAIHLELITSLSTEAFIGALSRFIDRRGRSSNLLSDNGTNFVGTKNLMEKLDWGEIEQYSAAKRITWKFNPPSAPWWGGFWERLVKSVKDLLKRNLGKAKLDYEELYTILCDRKYY